MSYNEFDQMTTRMQTIFSLSYSINRNPTNGNGANKPSHNVDVDVALINGCLLRWSRGAPISPTEPCTHMEAYGATGTVFGRHGYGHQNVVVHTQQCMICWSLKCSIRRVERAAVHARPTAHSTTGRIGRRLVSYSVPVLMVLGAQVLARGSHGRRVGRSLYVTGNASSLPPWG